MSYTSREVQLAARPDGMPTADTFNIETVEIGDPGDGEVVVKNLWMTVDPYMRGRMADRESYVPPFQLGKALEGGAIGEVVASGSDALPVGTVVQSNNGWREYFCAPADQVQKLDAADGIPVQGYLGAMGMPGLTAYAGLLRVGAMKEGDTVFVSAASGAVGSIACQIAKLKGCTVIGSAGSDEKVKWLQDELGVDHAFNYKNCNGTGDIVREVFKGDPKGIDVYFENVGGDHFDAAMIAMKVFGRVALCGMISQYNDSVPSPGPTTLAVAIGKGIKIEGFIVSYHADMMADFNRDMIDWYKAGKLKWQETVFDGIEKAPEAFMALFTGGNTGKCLVKLS